jgi:branched-chain amino acid transport system permease protein
LLKRLFRDFQGDVLAVPGRLLALVFVLVLLLLPLTLDTYFLRILVFSSIYVVFAVSWDLISGYTGQMNFGHALFFGVAAYVAALLNIHLELDPWLTIPLGALAGALAGLIVCLPALRLRGPYFALVTLALPFIVLGIVFIYDEYTGGELGLYGLDKIFSGFADPADNVKVIYYLSLAMMFPSVLIMWKLTDAKSSIVRTGIIFHAIREDEIAARACGINTIKYKMIAFAVGGFFAGIAGGFYAHFMGTVGPSTFALFLSFQAIIWVVFGGIASIYGAVVGVYILYTLTWEYLLRDVFDVTAEIQLIAFASIVVVVLLFMPQGIAVRMRDRMERTCPRCKLNNAAFRRSCRACGTSLQADRAQSITPDTSSG